MVSGFSDLDGEVTATTTLPAPSWIDLDTTVDDEIILNFQREDSNPDGDIAIYRSQTDGVLGSEIATVSPSTTTYTDSTANVDEVNYYTLRRDTGDTTTDSVQVNTLLPPPGITVTTTDSSATLSWSDAATTELRYNIYKNPVGGSETQVDTLPENTTSYDTDPLVPNAQNYSEYTYRVEAEKDGVSPGETTTASENVTFTVTAIQYGQGHTVVLRESDGSITQLNDEFRDAQLNLAHTQASQWDATVPYRPGLESVISPTTEAFIYKTQKDGSQDLLFRGNAWNSDTDAALSTNTTTLDGWDTAYRLRQDAAEETYTNIRAEDAIQDYWDTYTDFNATVQPQDPMELVSNEVAYSYTTTSDFSNNTDIAAEEPLAARNDNIELLQSNWIAEAESFASPTGDGAANADEFSDGRYVIFTDSTGSGGTLTFTIDHDIPEGELEIWYRNDGGGTSPGEVDWQLDGQSIGETNNELLLGWNEVFSENTQSVTAPALSAGQHTVSFSAGSDQTWDGNRKIDLVAPLDSLTRYTGGSDATAAYTFDNDNGGNGGYLDGPELYPVQSVNFATFNQSLNITDVDITSTWTDTSGGQELAASNDQKTTFVTASNSSTLTQSFSTVGTTLDVRATLSRYGSRTTATPQTGYLGQTLQDIEVRYSADDLAVFDSITVDRSDFRNLQNLHQQSDYVWSMDYREDELRVDSFPRASQTKTLDVIVSDHRRRLQTKDYYNTVIVRGAPDNNGNRTTVTAQAPQSELDKYGVVKAPPFIKDNLDTEADLESFARTKLREGLRGDDLRGTLDIFPEYVRPGYDYPVDELGGVEATLESVSYSMGAGGSLSGSLVFVDEPGVVPQVASLRGELGDVSDAN